LTACFHYLPCSPFYTFIFYRLQKALKAEQDEEEGSKVAESSDGVTKQETDVEDVKAEIELELKEEEKFEIEIDAKTEVRTQPTCFEVSQGKDSPLPATQTKENIKSKQIF
jgi:hypothetical protein